MSRRLARLIVLLGLALGVATAAAQSNLLVNGGGESDVGGDGFTNIPPSGWQATGRPTVTKYDGFGAADYFGTSDPGPAVRGANFITGGNNNATSTMTQTVDVSADGAAIDAGEVPFTLCGYLGGYLTQADAVSVTVAFRDAADGMLGAATIGPVSSADRQSTTALCLDSASGVVPPSTRAMIVTATFTRTGGA